MRDFYILPSNFWATGWPRRLSHTRSIHPLFSDSGVAETSVQKGSQVPRRLPSAKPDSSLPSFSHIECGRIILQSGVEREITIAAIARRVCPICPQRNPPTSISFQGCKRLQVKFTRLTDKHFLDAVDFVALLRCHWL